MAEKTIMYAPHQMRAVKRWADRQLADAGELDLAFICQHASCDLRTAKYLLGQLGFEGYTEVVQLVPEESPAEETPPDVATPTSPRRRGKQEEATNEVS